ncbi:MAG: hypothetical protein HKN82_20510 [Akkermansiaceae bacterium]|nr:hypothetical protein [Akkermansiaceae bacterium]
MKRTLKHAVLALSLAGIPAMAADETDCYDLSMTVSKAVTDQPNQVLEIVQREVATSPACSCEVVKAAIVASEASRDLVGQIVSTAIESAPDKMRLIAQCAIAVAPDALPEVQTVLAQLDPQSGDGGGYAKGGYAKGGYAKGGYAKGGYAKGGYEKGGVEEGGEIEPAGVLDPLDEIYLVPGIPFIQPPIHTPVSNPGS